MTIHTITNVIALTAPTQFRHLLAESEEKLRASWEDAMEEAALHEKKSKLAVTLSVEVDMDKEKIAYQIAFASRRKLSVEIPIPDPNQLELPVEPERPPAKRKF